MRRFSMPVISPMYTITDLIEKFAGIRIQPKKSARVRGVLEVHSNCPFCGGEDRFITRPQEGTYSCQIRASGCGAWGDALTFLHEYCSMTTKDACEELGISPDDLHFSVASSSHLSAPSDEPSPNKTWQERGERLVLEAQWWLRSALGKDALAYLRARGLEDGTILDRRLGFIPARHDGRWHAKTLEEWGLTAQGTGKDRVWLPEGILIPWYTNRKLWKLEVRRLQGLKDGDSKILTILGSQDTLYGWDQVTVDKPVVVCESALCAMTGEQESGHLAAFVATGGAKKYRPAWAKHLDQAPFTLIALDDDDSGDVSVVTWQKSLARSHAWSPWEKDINAMLCKGHGSYTIADWTALGLKSYRDLQTVNVLPFESALPSAHEKPVAQEPLVQPPQVKPYEPVSLPPLPRRACPFKIITWDAKGKQAKVLCKEKPLANGFCSAHQSAYQMLEIGAACGYPEVGIPHKWHDETRYRTIYAGVENWEGFACTLSDHRPSDTREKDVRFLESRFGVSYA
jgi:hypothetical protein